MDYLNIVLEAMGGNPFESQEMVKWALGLPGDELVLRNVNQPTRRRRWLSGMMINEIERFKWL